MARTICINIPEPQPLLVATVPGVGDVQSIRSFALGATNICEDARAFVQGLQPIMAGLGLPLCILGCVSAITDVFTDEFPYVDPTALPELVSACACLATFTPFGFCGLLRSVLAAINSLLVCITGLISDIVSLEAQVASLMANPETLLMGQCLGDNVGRMLASITESFEPVVLLMDSMEFLYDFVGVPFSPIPGLSGSDAGTVLATLSTIQVTISSILTVVNGVCPP